MTKKMCQRLLCCNLFENGSRLWINIEILLNIALKDFQINYVALETLD